MSEPFTCVVSLAFSHSCFEHSAKRHASHVSTSADAGHLASRRQEKRDELKWLLESFLKQGMR